MPRTASVGASAASASAAGIPSPGQLVIVRNRPAVVRDVHAYGHGGSVDVTHAVQVDYIDAWSHPEMDEVLWERETSARIVASLALPEADDPRLEPDRPERLHAFLDANRWSAANRLRTDPKAGGEPDLVSPWHSAVQVEDYQLYPVWKSLLMPRVALLLADDVGLGKTIEAGLIASELLVRRRIRRVLVLCPASLQQQWQDELREKFHLDFRVVDRDSTFRLQRELGMDSNPWATYPRVITSIDYLRQADILESFRAAGQGLTKGEQSMLPWQLLIVDEAHSLTPATFGDDSERCQMLRQVSTLFEHRLFLTATPHNGYTVSFTGLLELLDPVRFQQTSEMDDAARANVRSTMIRRLKRELPKRGDADRFAKRMPPRALAAALGPKERALFEALRSYREAGLALLEGVGRRERHIGEFLFTILTKRLLSSSYAFARTWWQHVAGFDLSAEADEVAHAQGRAEAPLTDDQEKGQREQDALRQGGAWLSRYAASLRKHIARVDGCLRDLGWTPEAIRSDLGSLRALPPDAKWDCLVAWMDRHLIQEGRLRSDERLIVFTEYKHTLDYLLERMERSGHTSPAVEALFGGVPAAWREQVKNAFNDPESPLRVLVATDTASEGINLQASCRYVVHQEIPWNPMRLEQRSGRVDRHGQARDVHTFHFTSDDEADLRFLSRIVEKVEQAREDLGSVGQVIDQAIITHFTRRAVDLDALDESIAAARSEMPDEEDMSGRDQGAADDYSHVLQALRATELALGVRPDRLARLLQQAARIEGGDLVEVEPDSGVCRLQPIPPGWRQLVDETLKIRQGAQAGSYPKLVFDPSYFERIENGRVIYRTKSDTALVRLGHPIMRRAAGTLRRSMWESRDLARWTVEKCQLPAGIEKVLVAYALLEVTNGLRETAHEEVLAYPFQVSGDHLTPLDSGLWSEIERLPRQAVAQSALATRVRPIRDQWHSHGEELQKFVGARKRELSRQFTKTMVDLLKRETAEQSTLFADRLKELDAQLRRRDRELERNQRRREQLRQRTLFLETEEERAQELREVEERLYNSHHEQMKQLLERERERTLTGVLPKRYELASLQLHPLAVEYIVRDDARRRG